MKHYLYITSLCISSYALAVFDATPGTSIWDMINSIGRTNQAIEGYATPITNADLPLTISTPGRYALVEQLNYAGGSDAITITTSNVYLTLNEYAINFTGGSSFAINVTAGAQNVSIVNGSIINSAGIVCFGSNDGLVVDSIYFNGAGVNNNYALDVAGGNNIRITNIRQDGLNNNAGGLFIANATELVIANCSLYNNVNTDLVVNSSTNVTLDTVFANLSRSVGLSFANSSNIWLRNCNVNNTTVSGPTNGNYLFNTCQYIIMDNCISTNAISNGIVLVDSSVVTCRNFTSQNDATSIYAHNAAALCSIINIVDSTMENSTISALVFDDGVFNVNLQNITITRPGATAIAFAAENVGSNYNVVIKNSTVFDLSNNSTASGILFANINNLVFKNNTASATGNIGHIFFGSADFLNSTVKNNTFFGNTVASTGFLCSHTNCAFVNNTVLSVIANAYNMPTVSNGVIVKCVGENSQEAGFNSTRVISSAISHCTFNSNLNGGILISGNTQYNAITYNTVSFTNYTGNNGISVSTGGGATGLGNYIGFNSIINSGDPTSTSVDGISIPDAGNAIFGNMIQSYPLANKAINSSAFFPAFIFACDGTSHTLPDSQWDNLNIQYAT